MHTPTGQSTTPTYDLADYLSMLRTGWWLVLTATVLGIATAAGITAIQPRVYEASTSVLVLPTGVPSADATTGRARDAINLDTEAQLVRSSSTAALAQRLLNSKLPPTQLQEAVTVTVPPNTAILQITYAADRPEAARAGSHAFAEAYLAQRQQSAKEELDREIKALQQQIAAVQQRLQSVTTELEQADFDTDVEYLSSQRENLSAQLDQLTGRLNELRATTLGGGRIISEAQTPTRPTKPVPALNLAAGLACGLFLGVTAAFLRRHFDRRVQRGADVVRRVGVPLLAELTPHLAKKSGMGSDAVFGAVTPAGRLFARLRNEVAASLETPAVVVVAGACRGTATPILATNLAVAFTRAGDTAALVFADPTWQNTSADATRLGVPRGSGLLEVLAGRAELDSALAPAPRYPGLSVLPIGSTANAAGLLQTESARRVLRALRSNVDYVIVQAPATAESADAQSLAIHADAVLLAVDLTLATDTQVADAAEQLHRVGTPLLGAVAIPPTTLPASNDAADTADSPTMVLPRVEDSELDRGLDHDVDDEDDDWDEDEPGDWEADTDEWDSESDDWTSDTDDWESERRGDGLTKTGVSGRDPADPVSSHRESRKATDTATTTTSRRKRGRRR